MGDPRGFQVILYLTPVRLLKGLVAATYPRASMAFSSGPPELEEWNLVAHISSPSSGVVVIVFLTAIILSIASPRTQAALASSAEGALSTLLHGMAKG